MSPWRSTAALLLMLGSPTASAQDLLDDLMGNSQTSSPKPSSAASKSQVAQILQRELSGLAACEADMPEATHAVLKIGIPVLPTGQVGALKTEGTDKLPAAVAACTQPVLMRLRRARVPPGLQIDLGFTFDLRGPLSTASLVLPVTVARTHAGAAPEATVSAVSQALEPREAALGQCVAKALWGDTTRGRLAPGISLESLIATGVDVDLTLADGAITAARVREPLPETARAGASEAERLAVNQGYTAKNVFEAVGGADQPAWSCYRDAFTGLTPAGAAGSGRVLVKVEVAAASQGYR